MSYSITVHLGKNERSQFSAGSNKNLAIKRMEHQAKKMPDAFQELFEVVGGISSPTPVHTI